MYLFFFTGLKIADKALESVAEAGLNEPQLISLAAKLPHFLLQSKACNTTKKYSGYFKQWDKFIISRGGKSLPAKDIHVALFITSLLEGNKSYGVVSTTVYSIKWFHELHGYEFIIGPYVRNLLSAAKRVPKIKVARKDPITSLILIELCQKYVNVTDLAVVRDLAMMLLLYAGFFRYDEVANLLVKDITLEADYVYVQQFNKMQN